MVPPLRQQPLVPYIRQGISYAVKSSALVFEADGRIALGPKRASFTKAVMDETTLEVRETVDACRKIGRWFAAAGDTTTILAAWGIRV
ncbi:three component ABC system middle component [Rhodothalassium salexigens]|uniref:three component ABC system middle component n=1 Tax=Rhodothalassium salexigens TaxID=1086 RepID=UPI003B8A981A